MLKRSKLILDISLQYLGNVMCLELLSKAIWNAIRTYFIHILQLSTVALHGARLWVDQQIVFHGKWFRYDGLNLSLGAINTLNKPCLLSFQWQESSLQGLVPHQTSSPEALTTGWIGQVFYSSRGFVPSWHITQRLALCPRNMGMTLPTRPTSYTPHRQQLKSWRTQAIRIYNQASL